MPVAPAFLSMGTSDVDHVLVDDRVDGDHALLGQVHDRRALEPGDQRDDGRQLPSGMFAMR